MLLGRLGHHGAEAHAQRACHAVICHQSTKECMACGRRLQNTLKSGSGLSPVNARQQAGNSSDSVVRHRIGGVKHGQLCKHHVCAGIVEHTRQLTGLPHVTRSQQPAQHAPQPLHFAAGQLRAARRAQRLNVSEGQRALVGHAPSIVALRPLCATGPGTIRGGFVASR